MVNYPSAVQLGICVKSVIHTNALLMQIACCTKIFPQHSPTSSAPRQLGHCTQLRQRLTWMPALLMVSPQHVCHLSRPRQLRHCSSCAMSNTAGINKRQKTQDCTNTCVSVH
jgi:hypothetical protein